MARPAPWRFSTTAGEPSLNLPIMVPSVTLSDCFHAITGTLNTWFGEGFAGGSIFGRPPMHHCAVSIGSYRDRSCLAKNGVFSLSRYFDTRFGSVVILVPVAP